MSGSDETRNSDDVDDVESMDSLDDGDDFDSGVVSDDYDDLDDDGDDEEDDYEDASPEEIDFVVALYREDGAPTVTELPETCANDLDELIAQLRRMPGDVGALGAVSINGEFFVLCRVRGRQVQTLLSDVVASNDWPLARDVVDFLGLEVPDPDDDSEPAGDMDILVDQGVSEFEMESLADDLDEDSDELVRRVIRDMKFGKEFDRVVADE